MSAVTPASPPLAVLLDSYDELAAGLQLPGADKALYESLFLKPLRAYRQDMDAGRTPSVPVSRLHTDATYGPLLGALQTTLRSLRQHETETVHVLRLIDAREEVLARLIACEDFYQAGKSSLDDAQVIFMVVLEELQMRTLQVVEAIQAWRAQLCRPFAFRLRSGQDYLERIRDDCEAISSCALGQLLSLHLDQFPCCSNVDLPRAVRRRQLMRRAKLVSTGAMWQVGLEPAQPDPTPAEHVRSAGTGTGTGTGTRPPWDDSTDLDVGRAGSAVLWSRARRSQANTASPVPQPAHGDNATQLRRAKQKRLVKAEAIILGAENAQEALMESLWQLAHQPTVMENDNDTSNKKGSKHHHHGGNADSDEETNSTTSTEEKEAEETAYFAPLLYIPTVVRYSTATGACVPSGCAETVATASTTKSQQTTNRKGGKKSRQAKQHKSKSQQQQHQAVCVPLDASSWTGDTLLQQSACAEAALPLAATAGGQAQTDTRVHHKARGASGRPPKSASPQKRYSSSSSSSSSSDSSEDTSHTSSSASASRASSMSLRSSHASSHARDSEAYQPYASSDSSAASSARGGSRNVPAPKTKSPPAKARAASSSSASSSSSAASSAESSPFVAKRSSSAHSESKSDASSSSSSAGGGGDGGRRVTQEESLEMLRQQLLEERRLSISRSQSVAQTPVATPTRVTAGPVPVPLPVPQPPAVAPGLSSPIALKTDAKSPMAPPAEASDSDSFETETETDSSD